MKIKPEDVVCVSLSGSKLYNLDLPSSDDDIGCVFRWTSPQVSPFAAFNVYVNHAFQLSTRTSYG